MLKRYLQGLIKHAVNVFSVVSLILAFVALILLPLSDFVNAIILMCAAFLSILAAGFYAWREAIESHPKEADLSIEYKSCTFHSSASRAGVPCAPMQFRVGLDAINSGQEPAVLMELKVVKFNMNNTLLGSQPAKTELLLTNPPHGNSQINCPYTIDGGKHLPNIEYRITVNIQLLEPVEFARRLGAFQDYEIELEYSYDDMARMTHAHTISIQGSFKQYREQCLKEWSKKKHHHELVVEAMKALEIVE